MVYYQYNFAWLAATCVALLVSQPTRAGELQKKQDENKKSDDAKPTESPDTKHPQRDFYWAYAFAMGADWLQGPYLYSLYQDEHGLSPAQVSSLFTTGFLSGAVSGFFVGTLADKYGRKMSCVLFCVLYALSCFLTMVPVVPLLFLGRALGGVSTSILFSSFDSWMVTDFKKRKLVDKGCDLSRTYGTMGTINSLAAMASGVASEGLVRFTGTKKSPFVASAVLLWLAMQTLWCWDENYGHIAEDKANNKKKNDDAKNDETPPPPQPSLSSVLKRPAILALIFATTMFEGSMYLFVFCWVPALQAVQKTEGELPYGLIFSSYMACVMAASLTFNLVMQRRLLKYSRLLVGLLVMANFVFVKLCGPRDESVTFWCFCLFEACVGFYWPCIGYLKGRMIDDGNRSRVYSMMRIPLNIFVVVSLMMTRQSDGFMRVFSICSVCLTAAFGAVWASTLTEAVP
ncbi:major facilitator superfamily transporter [Apiospora arundinis]|uniref:Molybdate-anion transporter n=1 Tax=Apiospora arundinis TaxID=335852 RepID=A0ABR2I0D3_9PEZI